MNEIPKISSVVSLMESWSISENNFKPSSPFAPMPLLSLQSRWCFYKFNGTSFVRFDVVRLFLFEVITF